jgi:GNAT superfamily N-acetyltransferase
VDWFQAGKCKEDEMSEVIEVRLAIPEDLPRMVAINAQVFLGDRDHPEGAMEWMQAQMNAHPVYQYFVILVDGVVAGYAGWQMHGGFHRAEPVVELDQIGIDPTYQAKGLGLRLLSESENRVVDFLMQKNDRIESHVSVVVWVYSLNFNAVAVYAKSFGQGVRGFRIQFGERGENMLRKQIPVVRKVRPENA